MLAPLAATLIQLAVSRSREYGADATGAAIHGQPESLARALEKLELGSRVRPLEVNPAAAHLFVVNPLTGGGFSNLFSTHPPVSERSAGCGHESCPVRSLPEGVRRRRKVGEPSAQSSAPAPHRRASCSCAAPWLIFSQGHAVSAPWLIAVLAGIAILGAAFLLSWAAELIQMDVSQALALALLALIAVLPEYAVDAVFAYQAGQDPAVAQEGYADRQHDRRQPPADRHRLEQHRRWSPGGATAAARSSSSAARRSSWRVLLVGEPVRAVHSPEGRARTCWTRWSSWRCSASTRGPRPAPPPRSRTSPALPKRSARLPTGPRRGVTLAHVRLRRARDLRRGRAVRARPGGRPARRSASTSSCWSSGSRRWRPKRRSSSWRCCSSGAATPRPVCAR